MQKETIQLTSSRKVGMRDINALLSAHISRIKTLRDNKGRMGFTLIELLVVVLIIAILAAIALPQYQKAVIKSRYASLKDLTKSIAIAQEVYYLSNGKYASRMNQLDIISPTPVRTDIDKDDNEAYIYSWGYCKMSQTNIFCRQLPPDQYGKSEQDPSVYYQIYYHNTPSALKGITRCIAETPDINSIQDSLCKQETQHTPTQNLPAMRSYHY